LTGPKRFDIVRNMKTDEAIDALAALAQASRLAVYRRLVVAGPPGLAAGVIAEELGIAPATLSFHLKELAHAGLVHSRQEGRFVFYSADFERMVSLVGFLTENCCQASGTACLPSACAPVAAPKRRSHETVSRPRRRR
jgi:DNA-binding transcriptional ArsR family regulator